ncbi:hypothetical protein A5659_03625 [Mycobacterium sp. 1165196.3]|nr:hypothetical protein A5659_03625 [Mycobacterium sp. 1165196.3]
MLTLKDGRRAAFEVTNLAADGALETASLLARDHHRWPLPGEWFWSIEVGSPQDLRRLKQCYQKIILICESAATAYPSQHPLAWTPDADPDLQWLIEDSSCSMVGHPEQLASAMQKLGAMVTPAARAGFIDDSLSGFAQELGTAFERPHIPGHFQKLARADADEHHLFIPLHGSALPFRISSVLMFDDAIPREPPPVPAHISHLWLAPEFSRRVLLWSQPDGWRNVFPYDN